MTRTHLLSTLFAASLVVSGCAPMQPENSDVNVTVSEMKTEYDRCSGQIDVVPYTASYVTTVDGMPNELTPCKSIRISVLGQGVAPTNTISPAQAYALAKRAAVADAYRMIAERVAGVHVEGHDYIKNMMVQRTEVRTNVDALIRNANIAETTFKEGLCEVEMEIILSYATVVL